MSDTTKALGNLAAAPMLGKSSGKADNWFEAMAEAWGRTLDNKAQELQDKADQISAGDDKPATITQLSAQAMEMSYLSQSSHTSLSSVGQALETMARKQ